QPQGKTVRDGALRHRRPLLEHQPRKPQGQGAPGRIGLDLRAAAGVIALICGSAVAQAPEPQQIQRGAAIYERNCSACHGARMQDPQGAFDLRKFPHDERERFINSVARGKNQMPPWGGLLKPEDIEALWAYVISADSVYGHRIT